MAYEVCGRVMLSGVTLFLFPESVKLILNNVSKIRIASTFIGIFMFVFLHHLGESVTMGQNSVLPHKYWIICLPSDFGFTDSQYAW